MLKEISPGDVVVRPFKVYKEWTLTESDITPLYGINYTSSLAYDETDPENSNGVSKISLYNSIKSYYYAASTTSSNSTTSSIMLEIGRRTSYTNEFSSYNERYIGDTIGVIAIPQIHIGEEIKSETVTLEYGSIQLTDDGYSNLVDSASVNYGNVFYDRGLIVLTKDIVDEATLTSFTVSYRSTVTIYENEILLTVGENEFNISQNPSSYDESGSVRLHSIQSQLDPTKFGGFGDYDYSSSIDPTGSYLTPFVTTIALYDDDLNMVVAAKLPKPVKLYPDYPLNFLIRFDT